MENPELRIRRAIEETQIIRLPRLRLATFGITNLQYYLVTEPSYQEIVGSEQEGVVREGRVIAERPAIVTPRYMLNIEGFSSEARSYIEYLVERFGPNSPGLLYTYKNEAKGMNIVGGAPIDIAHRIREDLERRGEDASIVILGVDALWDVSLLKSIYELTAASLRGNIEEFQSRGLLDSDPALGIPRAAIERIEELFHSVEQGADPLMLKLELDRWGLFERYQDRFLSLFKGRRG